VREAARYGERAIAPGGDRHEFAEAFLEWAGRYDEGGLDVRSRALHEAWLAKLACPVLRVDGTLPLAETLALLEHDYGKSTVATHRSQGEVLQGDAPVELDNAVKRSHKQQERGVER
jgi:hypothetical protein